MVKMVMIFSSEKARRHLLEKGFVLTFRTLHPNRKLGRDWITNKRGGKKIADVLVFSLGDMIVKPIPSMLIPYVRWTGFNTVDEWIGEIKKLNKPDEFIGLTGEIFCVVLR